MILVDVIKTKCEICSLIREIKRKKRQVKIFRQNLMERNNRYHDGRLEIDDAVEEEIRKARVQIYRLKREIVKKR
jgi:hypothetical protein